MSQWIEDAERAVAERRWDAAQAYALLALVDAVGRLAGSTGTADGGRDRESE